MPRQSVTIEQRRALRQWRKAQTGSITQKACIEWFAREFNHEISQSTVSESLSSKYSYLDEASLKLADAQARNRAGLYEDLETLLAQWQIATEAQGTGVSGENIRQKARLLWQELPQYQGKPCPQFSNRWVEGYKKRNQVRARICRGQNPSTPKSSEEDILKNAEDGIPKTSDESIPKSSEESTTKSSREISTKGAEDSITRSSDENNLKSTENCALKGTKYGTAKGAQDGTPKNIEDDTPMSCEDDTPMNCGDDTPMNYKDKISNSSEHGIEAFQNLTKEYNTEEIYNMTETVLFWRMTPLSKDSSLSQNNTRIEKSQVSLIVCTNATGTDRIPIWCIGKHRSPPSLHNVNLSTMGGEWRSNSRARMNESIMTEWLGAFYRHIGDKKVLLLLDNFSALSFEPSLCPPPSNVQLCWIPLNVSNQFRPVSQGIIQNLKAHYRQSWLEYMIEILDQGIDPLKTMNIRLALRWIFRSWYTNLTNSSIYSCFCKSGLLSSDGSSEVSFQIPNLTNLFLRLSGHFDNVISLNHFLNPDEEKSVDVNENNLHKDENERPGNEMIDKNEETIDEITSVPAYSVMDAKRALRVLQGFSEQNNCIDTSLIRSLESFEQRIKVGQLPLTQNT